VRRLFCGFTRERNVRLERRPESNQHLGKLAIVATIETVTGRRGEYSN
jgi:hypothetical protein